MSTWPVIVAMGIVTYAIRLSMIFLLGKVDVPDIVQRGLRFVPPAVLTAIIIPELLRPGGSPHVSLVNARLAAGILAAFVAWRTRNVILTIALGMAVLWLLQTTLLPVG
jgi:branched-subunit amino acid transport protein